MDVNEIIDRCGGASKIGEATKKTRFAVYKWTKTGIPKTHWDTIMSLSGISLSDLYEADRVLRSAKPSKPPPG